MSNVIPRRPGMIFEQCERASDMLTAGMSARDVAQHFQQIGNGADCVKQHYWKTVFSRLHLHVIDFCLVES